MNKPSIPFNKPYIAGKELYYIARAVMAGHLSGDGPYTRLCHSWLEKELGTERALLTHSCTAALEIAALLLDIKPGDECILPSFTFVSTANAFALRGGIPVFVDIDPETLTIDIGEIKKAISSRTRVIVPVHYAGYPCDMDGIMNLAREAGAFVVEDAAQALFSKHREKHLGTIGDLGCLSFHETKNLISGEGGALLVNNRDLISRAEIIREKGTNRSQFFRGEIDKYTWIELGSSYLPSELIGAFLYAQFEEAGTIFNHRRTLCEKYRFFLDDLERIGRIRLPLPEGDHSSNGHLFYILTGSLKEREELISHLNQRGINAVFHYIPLHTSPAGRKFGRVVGSMSVTDDVSDRLLRLPLFNDMTEEDVESVCVSIRDFYSRKSC